MYIVDKKQMKNRFFPCKQFEDIVVFANVKSLIKKSLIHSEIQENVSVLF